MITFAVQNVISDPPFNKMDLVMCRNLLIYFEVEQQKEVLSTFHFSLHPGGFLVLGKSETNLPSSSSCFEVYDQKWRIFQRKRGPSSHKDSKYLQNFEFIANQKRLLAPDSSAANGVWQQLSMVWMTEYVPPCFVVDIQGNLRHTFGTVMPYMRFSGKATLNILKIVQKDLSTSIGIAIRRASNEKRTVMYKEVHLRGMIG